ncbi:flavo protein oxygenase [Acaromyces ingoldii]|uniref:Flavo protein oxygenase n=1 Tax=Acaromyces ingoldii TaxID=215250 RepID=A0A316YH59_9BASI|nr:flavo protein oxygenase [Acaromyces ingoldii]PWN88184.1 flavo protein oxygenase [Acaromyces ingoldii]
MPLSRALYRPVVAAGSRRVLSTSARHAQQGRAKRPPFDEVQRSRPDFEALDYVATKTPDPAWKTGTGANGHPSGNGSQRRKEMLRADELGDAENYKLIVGGIIPRPIALVSSHDATGKRNLAPFSYFGAVGHKPPMVMISFNSAKAGQKDSAANILETKRFSVNIISESFVEAANYTSIDAPHDVSEWDLSGLTPSPSRYWPEEGDAPPTVGESAYSLECELHDSMSLLDDDGKETGKIIVGRIRAYILNEGIIQPDGSLSPGDILPIARGGGITYLRSTHGLELPRPRWSREGESETVKSLLAKR